MIYLGMRHIFLTLLYIFPVVSSGAVEGFRFFNDKDISKMALRDGEDRSKRSWRYGEDRSKMVLRDREDRSNMALRDGDVLLQGSLRYVRNNAWVCRDDNTAHYIRDDDKHFVISLDIAKNAPIEDREVLHSLRYKLKRVLEGHDDRRALACELKEVQGPLVERTYDVSRAMWRSSDIFLFGVRPQYTNNCVWLCRDANTAHFSEDKKHYILDLSNPLWPMEDREVLDAFYKKMSDPSYAGCSNEKMASVLKKVCKLHGLLSTLLKKCPPLSEIQAESIRGCFPIDMYKPAAQPVVRTLTGDVDACVKRVDADTGILELRIKGVRHLDEKEFSHKYKDFSDGYGDACAWIYAAPVRDVDSGFPLRKKKFLRMRFTDPCHGDAVFQKPLFVLGPGEERDPVCLIWQGLAYASRCYPCWLASASGPHREGVEYVKKTTESWVKNLPESAWDSKSWEKASIPWREKQYPEGIEYVKKTTESLGKNLPESARDSKSWEKASIPWREKQYLRCLCDHQLKFEIGDHILYSKGHGHALGDAYREGDCWIRSSKTTFVVYYWPEDMTPGGALKGIPCYCCAINKSGALCPESLSECFDFVRDFVASKNTYLKDFVFEKYPVVNPSDVVCAVVSCIQETLTESKFLTDVVAPNFNSWARCVAWHGWNASDQIVYDAKESGGRGSVWIESHRALCCTSDFGPDWLIYRGDLSKLSHWMQWLGAVPKELDTLKDFARSNKRHLSEFCPEVERVRSAVKMIFLSSDATFYAAERE